MTDTTQGETTDVVKRAVAKHYLLDAAGAVVENEEEATGVRYHHIASGQTFDFQVPNATVGAPETMLAIFGAKTLATNEASAVRNGNKGGDEVAAINDRFATILGGKWADRTREGVKIDLDMLAEAVCRVMVESGQATDEQIASGIKAKVREKLEDKAQVTFVNSVPGVKARYAELVGKTTRSVADLASLVS